MLLRCSPIAFVHLFVLWMGLVFPRPTCAADDVPERCLGIRTHAVRCFFVPKLSFDTDDGFGTGARLEAQWAHAGGETFRRRIMLDSYVTLRGWQLHQFRWDEVEVGPRDRGRITVNVAYRQRLNDDYWGLGNGTVRDEALLGPFDDEGDPRSTFYQFRMFQPFAHLTWRQELDDKGLEAFVAINPRLSIVRTYDASLLEEQQPYGIEGGFAIQLFAGILHDTRDNENAPRRGHLAEVSGRVTPQLPGDVGGQAGGFFGGLVSGRGYVSAGSRVVIASRAMAEWLVGDVPFYEMVWWGGAIPVRGMGGFETVRGLELNRLYGPGKAVANLEARLRVLNTTIFKRAVGWELAPFADAGVVWGAGEQGLPGVPFHPGLGVGGRIVLQETFVGRADVGWGWDPVRDVDGTVRREPRFGFYAFLDYPF